MKMLDKINLLKKARVLNEEEMKLLIGGTDGCGGGGYKLYNCAWSEGSNTRSALVCATSLDSAWANLKATIKFQLGVNITGVCVEGYTHK